MRPGRSLSPPLKRTALRLVAHMGCSACVASILLSIPLRAQQPDQDTASQTQPAQVATVHGVVRDAATGEPMPRALVRIDGDASAGALTNGEGRFEIPDVPVGPQEFEVIKPGFIDQPYSSDDDIQRFIAAMDVGGHNVMVASPMGDVIFTLSPANAIQGQIQLSTGDPATGITVVLLRRTIQSGRFTWSMVSTTKANSDSVYRFGELPDGEYAVYTNPALDSDPIFTATAAGSAANVKRSGYPAQFYPEARDITSAVKIRLAGGAQAQANLSLALEPFHGVTARLTFPGGKQGTAVPVPPISVEVLDDQRNQLPYQAQYEAATHTAQAYLPDGGYTLLATASTGFAFRDVGPAAVTIRDSLMGAADISVSGHALAGVRIPLAAIRQNEVQVDRVAASVSPASSWGGAHMANITLSPDGGWMSGGMVTSYAEGPLTGPLEAQFTRPGRYWAHTNIADRQYCEGSLTAGGVSLGREPLTIGMTGPAAPVTLTLRSDCARLTLTLPGTAGISTTGQEPFYIVYAVPDFDSTSDVIPVTLRPSTGGRITLTGLTPGSYHVYTFDQLVEIPYHDANAMAALASQGQAVTLAPDSESTLVLEVSQH